MPRGADDRYWGGSGLPSVFKHSLLEKYVPQFAGMTGSRTANRRVVFLDGYAGRGRYMDGAPASAERILKIAQYQGSNAHLSWTCFFVEREEESATRLAEVVAEYAAQGVAATAHHEDVGDILGDVVRAAVGCPLFIFLDPCGLGLPYERLKRLLRQDRKDIWPPTELLLNFSLEAVRRIGGHVSSEHKSESAMRRLDVALGGDWWRAAFENGVTDISVATVVSGFRERLAIDSGMDIVSVPVRRAPTHEPLYHLLFGTRRQHGLWSFGDSVARATQAWWDTLEELEIEQDQLVLFPASRAQRPSLVTVENQAIPYISNSLEGILRRHERFRVVDHTREVFGDYYGQVRETVVRNAIKRMNHEGRTSSTGMGSRIRDLEVARPQT